MSNYSQMEGKGGDESQKMGVGNDLRKVKQKLERKLCRTEDNALNWANQYKYTKRT